MPAALRLSEAIDEYLAVLGTTAAPSTVKCQKSALLRFLAVTGNIYPRNLGTQHVDAFLVKHKDWQPNTKLTHIRYLSKFQSWLHSRKLLDRGVDILEGRRRVKVPKKRRARIKAEQFEALLDSAPNPRDRIILALGLFLLVRVSEMVTVQWKHVDLDNGVVQVYQHKVGKPDSLPVCAELHDELVRWRNHLCRTTSRIAPDPEWFVACAGEPARHRAPNGRIIGTSDWKLTPERPLLHPRQRIHKLLTDLGVTGEGVGMHTLRRSGAQALLESIEEGRHDESAIRVVQSMLGHSTIATTEIYLDRDIDKARRDALIRGKTLYRDGTHTGGVVDLTERRASGAERSGVL